MSELKADQTNQSQNQNPDPNYWRSFEALYNDPDVLEAKGHEFKKGVTDDFTMAGMSHLSRRKFLALLGASAALAGTACTDYRDKGEIIPYNVKPEEITVGKPNYYASTCTGCAIACGILIKTREGRPIKVDGNPDHPVNKGKICAKGQANILNLYDPERIKNPLKQVDGKFESVRWKDADSEIMATLSFIGSKEIAFVTHTVVSPTAAKLFEDFKVKYPSTKIYSYELFNNSVKNSAWNKTHGSANYPLVKWNEAKVILSLESDFLGTDGNKVEASRMFAEARNVDTKSFNRLYCVDSTLTITGINADYRLRLKPDAQYEFVMSLMNELSNKNALKFAVNTSGFSLRAFAEKYNLKKELLDRLVADLSANKGKAIIDAGYSLAENVYVAVNILNEALGNTAMFRSDSAENTFVDYSSLGDIESLIQKMNAGRIGILVHLNCNPVYHFADDHGYKDALSKVGVVVSLSERENETTYLSKFVLPANHSFESWGDAKTRTGVISLQQPVIAPIHDTRQKEAVILNWLNGNTNDYTEKLYHDYLMKNWEDTIYPKLSSKLDFKRFWLGALHDGIVLVNENVSSPVFNSSAAGLLTGSTASINGYTVVIKESYAIADGRFAHNGWLQELPHPVSKITWDNYAAVSEKTCKELGVRDNDLVEITIGNRKLKLPVFMQAGSADNVITIESGYGKENSGTVASGVGFNVNKLLSKSSNYSNWIYTDASVTKSGGTYELASTQEHHAFDDPKIKDLHKSRGIIQEATVAGYLKNPNVIKENHHDESISVNPPMVFTGLKWGMAIDLNKCTGCGDCIVACNVENNIPVVGKDQVLRSREMQWLRIDRYYSGTPDDPSVSVQPMLCQHCDSAPCETVCPVVATNHSPDGLNQMVYNRCVGTRYCSNNCPYKVRRYNFYNYRDHFNDSYQESPIFALLHNPEVTVRSRGVMEKCTFCVQRISEARADATHDKRTLKGSDVTTACQDACGSNAIYFGDINDKETEFYKYRNHELGFYVLEELNIKPNVTYIAKLRNIHSEEA